MYIPRLDFEDKHRNMLLVMLRFLDGKSYKEATWKGDKAKSLHVTGHFYIHWLELAMRTIPLMICKDKDNAYELCNGLVYQIIHEEGHPVEWLIEEMADRCGVPFAEFLANHTSS